MRLCEIYSDDFAPLCPLNLIGIPDLDMSPDILSLLPPNAFHGCNRLILSLILRKDIRKDLDAGCSADGTTDRCPFLTPLVWNAILNHDDWETERRNIEIMLDYPIDCNKIGLCGFNLYHFYIIGSKFTHDMRRLMWWTQHPMIDLDVVFVNISIRRLMYPLDMSPPSIIPFLVSMGVSLSETHEPQSSCDNDIYELRRRLIHWDCRSLDELREKMRYCSSLLVNEVYDERGRSYDENNICVTATPQMNDLCSIPTSQILYFDSACGVRFAFHCAYLSVITQNHHFPFTQEPISRAQVHEWMRQIRESGQFRREEYPLHELIASCPLLTPQVQLAFRPMLILHNWLVHSFPYTRILLLEKKSIRVFQYLCREMSRGEYIFSSFSKAAALGHIPDTDWKMEFFWRARSAIEDDGFLFCDRLEILIARLEILESLDKNETTPFHNRITSHSFSRCDRRLIDLYRSEYGVSLYELYTFIRALSVFLSKS